MKLSLEIVMFSPLWRRFKRARSMVRETIEVCIEEAGAPLRPGTEIGVCLSDDAHLRQLNARWRSLDTPTNVLAFPAAASERIGKTGRLGDIALAYETLVEEADEMGIAPADHYRHLVAHGFLHLIGYDHQSEGEAGRMEALEKRILRRLGVSDPYGDSG
ncbi:MAG: rRNA maturation RNase YbeY [Hyphomicrobiales bacterium]|nr:rRNA maturation RNase YbeY [Hyphomicrobiales bacterium]